MFLSIYPRPVLGKSCDALFFYPAEVDGPGTLAIFEYRCVLRLAHDGPHQVETRR